MNPLLWSPEPYIDIIYIGSATLLAIFLALIFLVPGLWRTIQRSYLHSRTENIHEYISRYIPASIYARLIDISTACTLSLLTLEAYIRFGMLPPPQTHLQAISTFGWFTLCVLSFAILRRLHFELWSYVFMPSKQAAYLLQDYLVLTIGQALALCLWLIVAQAPIDPIIWVWGTIGTLGFISIIRSLQTIRRLNQRGWLNVYIFLYLCTHEFLPWIIGLLFVV